MDPNDRSGICESVRLPVGYWDGSERPAAGTEPLCGIVSKVSMLAQLPLDDATLVLRRAEVQDVASIVQILAADQLGATRDGVATDEDLQPYLRAFEEIDADPAHLLLVTIEGSQVLATMQLSFLPGLARRGARRAQIEAVRVRQDYRGRGLGAALFGWAIEEARRRECA